MLKSLKAKSWGLSLAEVVVSLGVLALTTVVMTQAMLVLNRNSAVARVRNLAKAAVLGRVQEVNALPLDPASGAPIPTLLQAGSTTTDVDLGDSSADIGRLPAKIHWTVAKLGSTETRSIRCRAEYTYLGRPQNYEVVTFRAPN